jgi:hypothetical protein
MLDPSILKNACSVTLLYIYCDIPGALFDHLELNRRSKVEILQVTNTTMTKETEIHPSIYYLSSSSLLDRPLILRHPSIYTF